MDQLIKAIATDAKIRFVTADVTMAAKALEARHLSGPTASMALAEGLVAVALLSADASQDEEAVMLRLNAAGPIGGLMVEAMGHGGLRGFTNTKILNDLDSLDTPDTDAAWGNAGAVQILTSLPGRIINQAALNVNPPRMRFILARYFNHSMQIPTACALWVDANADGLLTARGILAQRMEDSDPRAFVRVLEAFEKGGVEAQLQKNIYSETFRDMFELPDLVTRETRPLMFKCRCTKARTLSVLKTLSPQELDAMLNCGEPQNITCHMCGHTYTAAPDDIKTIRDNVTNAQPDLP